MKVESYILISAYLAAVGATPVLQALAPRVSSTSDDSCGNVVDNTRNCYVECNTDHPGGDYKSLSGIHFHACQNACASDPQCQTAQFNGGNCYLKGTTNAGVANNNVKSIVCDPSPPFTETINGQQCTFTYNLDRRGGDYANQYTGTFEACGEACANDPNCITAQYNYGSGQCYLKNAANPSSSSDNTDTVDCRSGTSTASLAPPASASTPTPTASPVINGRQCFSTPGYNRNGGDYNSFTAQSFDDCASACGNDDLCQSAQFNEGNSVCYMKNAQNPGNSAPGTDTIDCANTITLPDSAGNPRVCTFSPRMDRGGGNYLTVAVNSYTECVNQCASDDNCVTAQFNEGNSQCYMKSTSNTLGSSTTTDTVDCAQPQSS